MKKSSEDVLMEIHIREGKKRFGKKFESANVGWGVDVDCIESKVYGSPTKIFTSFIDVENGRVTIKHQTTIY